MILGNLGLSNDEIERKEIIYNSTNQDYKNLFSDLSDDNTIKLLDKLYEEFSITLSNEIKKSFGSNIELVNNLKMTLALIDVAKEQKEELDLLILDNNAVTESKKSADEKIEELNKLINYRIIDIIDINNENEEEKQKLLDEIYSLKNEIIELKEATAIAISAQIDSSEKLSQARDYTNRLVNSAKKLAELIFERELPKRNEEWRKKETEKITKEQEILAKGKYKQDIAEIQDEFNLKLSDFNKKLTEKNSIINDLHNEISKINLTNKRSLSRLNKKFGLLEAQYLELEKENGELKNENQKLKKDRTKLRSSNTKLNNENIILKEEIIEDKKIIIQQDKENQELKDIIYELEHTDKNKQKNELELEIQGKDNILYSQYNEIKKLKEENERLKNVEVSFNIKK